MFARECFCFHGFCDGVFFSLSYKPASVHVWYDLAIANYTMNHIYIFQVHNAGSNSKQPQAAANMKLDLRRAKQSSKLLTKVPSKIDKVSLEYNECK